MRGNVPINLRDPCAAGRTLLAQEGRVPRLGQKLTSGRGAWMSTPPSTADICQGEGYVRFVPLAEVVRLQRDLFQETLHCCPRPAVRLLVVQCACQERPVRRGICEGMVGVAVSDN